MSNKLSKTDINNSIDSYISKKYNGSSTSTIGYDYITISIYSNESSITNSLNIYFSDDNITFIKFYSDNYIGGQKFIKSYKILKTFYKITFENNTSSLINLNITTQLNTNYCDMSLSNKTNIFNFDNYEESKIDAYNKLRVTNPFTLIEIKFPYDNNGTSDYLKNNLLITTKESGTGTITKTYEKSMGIFNIQGDNSTTSFISQSRKYCNYQPGKSLLFLASGIINNTVNTSTDYQTYIGYFDDNNGLFFMNDSGIISVNLRDSGDYNNTTTIIQSNWNIDTCDENSPNNIIVDFTKSQLFVIDIEWLSVGRIRFGLYIYGKIYYIHQITNYNILDSPYMLTANLPIRYQIDVNDSGIAQLTQICSTVISEGGYNPVGKSFTINNGISSISVTNTEKNLLAITGNDNYYHQNIIPLFMNFVCDTNNTVLYKIKLIIDSIDNSSWTDINTDNSVIKYSLDTDIDITSGTYIIIDSGYITDKNYVTINDLSNTFNKFNQITSNIDNTSDILLITAQKINSGTISSYISLTWDEIN